MPLDIARRGTLDVRDPPLKAIVAANDNYEAGYHKGNAGGLDAIDTDLATANIKNGITIFGKVGSADVRDISDATAIAAEVIEGETFYAVSGGIRTGTMPIVALDPALNEYPAGYHAGEASLTAVDAHLAAGNIADGVVIFGVTGTLVATLSEDAIGVGYLPNADAAGGKKTESVAGGGDYTMATVTKTYTAGSLMGGLGMAVCACNTANCIKVRMNMGGVQVYESAFIPDSDASSLRVTHYETRALSGSQVVNIVAHNYDGGSKVLYIYGAEKDNGTLSGGVFVVSVKG